MRAPIAVVAIWRRWPWLLFLPLGALWCWYAAGEGLAARLDPAYETRPVGLSGWVSSLPEPKGELTEFQFSVENLDGRGPGPGIPASVQLNLQSDEAPPRAG